MSYTGKGAALLAFIILLIESLRQALVDRKALTHEDACILRDAVIKEKARAERLQAALEQARDAMLTIPMHHSGLCIDFETPGWPVTEQTCHCRDERKQYRKALAAITAALAGDTAKPEAKP